MRKKESAAAFITGLVWPTVASAHVSEQGFVLLLPTAGYIAAGVAVVVLTVLAVFALPDRITKAVFTWRPITERRYERARQITSLLSFLLCVLLVYIGLAGPHHPLENLVTLGFWTIWWIGIIPLASVFGNLWTWINPWTGLHRLIGPVRPVFTLPKGVGSWPAVVLMVGFGLFMLADLAPADPERLAVILGVYWAVTMGAMMLFGSGWLAHVDIGMAIFRTYGSLAPVRLRHPAGIGVPGWQLSETRAIPGAGAFVLTLLAIGSFDGINETFLWFGAIGINPLEFPGRSAVVVENAAGLIVTILVMMIVFAGVVRLGLSLARSDAAFADAFNRLAISLAPIALAYHLGHYLTAFIVNIQYTVLALGDPFETGAELFGIPRFNVTTGFFNRIDTVRFIWLTQAGIIVLGHVWSVLLGHRVALYLMPESRKALRATFPVSLLMIGYTFLGLWLLATPRGA